MNDKTIGLKPFQYRVLAFLGFWQGMGYPVETWIQIVENYRGV